LFIKRLFFNQVD